MLFVLSGPSGVGKGTLRSILERARPELRVPVSYTSRIPRNNEVDGVHYFFTNREEFMKMVNDGLLVEWAEVHGNLYGTPWSELHRTLSAGSVLLEIDCQGAKQVKARFPATTSIFILPPSVEELRKRLAGRGTDFPEAVERRLKNACEELAQASEFDYYIVNDDLVSASAKLIKLVDKLVSGENPDMMEFANPTLLRSTLTALGTA